MGDSKTRSETGRKFSDEFKRDTVALVIETGWPIGEVAAGLGLYDPTRGNWIPAAREQQRDGQTLTRDERARLRELEAETHATTCAWVFPGFVE